MMANVSLGRKMFLINYILIFILDKVKGCGDCNDAKKFINGNGGNYDGLLGIGCKCEELKDGKEDDKKKEKKEDKKEDKKKDKSNAGIGMPSIGLIGLAFGRKFFLNIKFKKINKNQN